MCHSEFQMLPAPVLVIYVLFCASLKGCAHCGYGQLLYNWLYNWARGANNFSSLVFGLEEQTQMPVFGKHMCPWSQFK